MTTSTSVPPPQSVEDLYKIVREQIEHEDNLNTQRLNWFLTSQSFLFSAYAIVLNGLAPTVPARSARNAAQMRLVMVLIPVLAMVANALIFMTIAAGQIAMSRLRRRFLPYEPAADLLQLPPIQGHVGTRILGQVGPLLLPALFFAVWFVLLMHGSF
jgi:hypothetical protein